jgi:hypothetical protein
MKISIAMILVLLAVICWFLAAIGVPSTRINLTAAGLFFFGLSLLVGGK